MADDADLDQAAFMCCLILIDTLSKSKHGREQQNKG